MRIDFALAEKKSPVYMSMYARLSIVGTKVILSYTHLTTDPDVGTLSTMSDRCYSNVIPLSKEVSIGFPIVVQNIR